MKKYKYIVLITVLMLFTNGSCKYQEGQRFIVQNNSDQEVIIMSAHHRSIAQDTFCFIINMTKFEYQDFIYFRMIRPYSNKNFERMTWGESLIGHRYDTLYISVFNRADVDTMSCEEFKQKFPLKKEWKVTLADMQARDWVLVYTPDTQGVE